jgi:hypothetical protein
MEVQDEKAKKAGRPRTILREITKSSQKGIREGYTRATFIVNEDLLEKVKNVAYWERKQIKDVVEEALESHVAGRDTRSIPPTHGRPYKGA